MERPNKLFQIIPRSFFRRKLTVLPCVERVSTEVKCTSMAVKSKSIKLLCNKCFNRINPIFNSNPIIKFRAGEPGKRFCLPGPGSFLGTPYWHGANVWVGLLFPKKYFRGIVADLTFFRGFSIEAAPGDFYSGIFRILCCKGFEENYIICIPQKTDLVSGQHLTRPSWIPIPFCKEKATLPK